MQQQQLPFRFPKLTPTVKKLLILQGVAFVAFAVVEKLAGVPLFRLLALDVNYSDGFLLQLLWQPLTFWLAYPPQPAALMDVGLSMLTIYFFLCPFEEAFGTKRTLQLTAAGILGAAIPCILFGFLLDAPQPIYGSAPIFLASLGAFPVIAKGRKILFMFILPMNTWTIIGLGVGLSALYALLGDNPFLFIEHVGALFAGLGFARFITRGRARPAKKKPRRKGGPDLRVVPGGMDDDDKPRWLN